MLTVSQRSMNSYHAKNATFRPVASGGSAQRGFTLIEIMVASTISLILLGGVMQIFLSSKKTYTVAEEVARLQENGRFALDVLARDIRMVGYQGCADPETVPATVIARDPPTTDFSLTGLQGSEISDSEWEPALPTGIPDDITDEHGNAYTLTTIANADSDVIIVQHASTVGTELTGNTTPDNGNIQLTNNSGNFAADDVLMISDCDTVDIFRANNVSSGSGSVTIAHSTATNTTNRLSKSYPPGARILRFNSNLYFVSAGRKSDGSIKTNSRGNTINALYSMDINGNIVELVEGVDSLQLLYGERIATGNVRYLTADDSNLDMTRVDSVRVALLMSTIEAVTDKDDTRTYRAAGTDIEPAGTSGAAVTYAVDRRIRRIFTATINLRNRQ